jgi:FtsH-binding integral membrane protein
MAQIDNRYAARGAARTEVAVDEGLRAYMLRVYNYMAGGVFLTGVIAYFVYSLTVTTDANLAAHAATGAVIGLKRGMYLTPLGAALFTTPLHWLVILLPLGFVFFLSMRIYRMSLGAAQTTFWLFAAAMGVSLSSIFLAYTQTSITQVFFVTAAAFGSLSLYGYTTRKDLSGWGSFLIMGVFGIVIAALVNLFLQSSALQFAISVIGVLVFSGLTAYDTQRIKDGYYEVMGDMTAAGKAAILGALQLYLDFINLFVSLLQLFGNRD